MTNNYFNTLKDDDLKVLADMVSDDYIVALRVGPDTTVKEAALKVDKILSAAPKTERSTLLYVTFKGPEVEHFRLGGELTDNSFLIGSKNKSKMDTKDAIVLAVKVPAGIHVLETDDWILLPRGIELTMEPSENGVIHSAIKSINPIKL